MTPVLAALADVTLLSPWWLLAALAVPAAILLRRRGATLALRFAPATFLFAPAPGLSDAPLRASLRVRLAALPGVLHSLAVLAVVIALARPVVRTPLPLRAEGIDIVLCLDVSSSMTARDLDARRTRLDVAREAALAFVAGRAEDRIGLVTFARYPDLRCPPTRDHEALSKMIAAMTAVKPDGPEDATGIGAAVARAAQTAKAGDAKSKVVVLLTDGEETVAMPQAKGEIAPAHAAQLAAESGVRVHVIAAGAGKADTKPVERLAERTGGAFFAADDARSVAAVWADIDRLERAALEETRYVTEERFSGFVAAAFLLVVAASALRATFLRGTP